MDTGRLPAYRFSYLLRFHPYPRAKPSVRERIEASAREHELHEQFRVDILRLESDASSTLDKAIHATQVHNEARMSSLVVDLALVTTKKQSAQAN